jgi:D-alanine transfer protein
VFERPPGAARATPHLSAALLAGALLGATLLVGLLVTTAFERRYVHALAPQLFDQKNQGSAIQVAAFAEPDLLPVYGSSEFDFFRGPFTGMDFFRAYPTGFQLSPIGRRGTTAAIVLQDLAAVGEHLRGRKVAICISPTFLFHDRSTRRTYYEGNFSRLHANELVFNSPLSARFKHTMALRMLRYPKTLNNDPLLDFTLQHLVAPDRFSQALVYAAAPLGRLQTSLLELQDHWATLRYIQGQRKLDPEVTHQPAPLDWQSILPQAQREAQTRGNSNQFAFENQFWSDHGSDLIKQQHRATDGDYLRTLRKASWPELTTLLDGLRELGAQPLLLSVPIKGAFYDYWGVSEKARSFYYQRLRALVRPYGFPLLDFAEFDADRYFVADDRSHPSQEGWAYYDQALDAFFHGAPLATAERSRPVEPRPIAAPSGKR